MCCRWSTGQGVVDSTSLDASHYLVRRIEVEGGSLSPPFAPDATDYAVRLPDREYDDIETLRIQVCVQRGPLGAWRDSRVGDGRRRFEGAHLCGGRTTCCRCGIRARWCTSTVACMARAERRTRCSTSTPASSATSTAARW